MGDVNLFLNDCDDTSKAEIEIMIAVPEVRRKGFGKEWLVGTAFGTLQLTLGYSTLLMMRYASENLGITTFQAKISISNSASIHLFQNVLQFEVSSKTNHAVINITQTTTGDQ